MRNTELDAEYRAFRRPLAAAGGALPRNTASALLQRCGARGVLAIASEQPDAFTDADRRRLAALAEYLQQVT